MAIAFIEAAREEEGVVLVHCWAGISRSVTVCLAYLMFALHYRLDDAFDLLLKQNGTIAPNFHFMESLLCWERRLFADPNDSVDECVPVLERPRSNPSSVPSSAISTTSSNDSGSCSSSGGGNACGEGVDEL